MAVTLGSLLPWVLFKPLTFNLKKCKHAQQIPSYICAYLYILLEFVPMHLMLLSLKIQIKE